MYLTRKNLFWDGISWSILLFILAAIAFFLMARDSRKQFGTISFGAFPEFSTVDGTRVIDQHQLKSQLSAILITDQTPAQDVLLYLQKLSQVTLMGKKYLHGIVFSNEKKGISDKWIQYVALNQDQYSRLKIWKDQFKGNIILVDQNGIVRGVFDLDDKLQRINFEGAVKGIL